MRHKEALGILVGSDQGRTTYTANLVALAERLGVAGRLRIVGHADDMPAALMLADIVVNCSTSPEAFGRTIVEAQAMGRIVVAADHGGARETIENGSTGLLVPPNNAAALAAMLDSVLDQDVAARIKFGTQAARPYRGEFFVEGDAGQNDGHLCRVARMSRVLVIRHGAFGDIVLSFAAMAAIRDRHVHDEITLLTTRLYGPLLRRFTLVRPCRDR